MRQIKRSSINQFLFTLIGLICIGCYCDDCVNFDLLNIRLRTQDYKDYLFEKELSRDDVRILAIVNDDTVPADHETYSTRDNDSTLITIEVTYRLTKLYIEVNGQIKDSVELNLDVNSSNCCAHATTIKSVISDNNKQDYSGFDTIDIIIE